VCDSSGGLIRGLEALLLTNCARSIPVYFCPWRSAPYRLQLVWVVICLAAEGRVSLCAHLGLLRARAEARTFVFHVERGPLS
jgi:hypothetical protein